jgi:DNA modification methylase
MADRVEIGDAVLYHGDCLEILPTLPKVDAVVTDPPYGISWEKPFLANGGGRPPSRAHDGIANDGDCSARDGALRFADRAVCFGSFLAPFPPKVKQVLVWQKPGDSGLFGTVAGYRRDVEPIFLCGDWPAETVARSSVLTAAAHFRGHMAAHTASHPHAKPVDLLEKIINPVNATTILDPFMGSGTTGVACANLGRKFIGIEIERKYFDIACERIAAAYAQGRLFA